MQPRGEEDEMVGQGHRSNQHEFDPTLGGSGRQEGLMCSGPRRVRHDLMTKPQQPGIWEGSPHASVLASSCMLCFLIGSKDGKEDARGKITLNHPVSHLSPAHSYLNRKQNPQADVLLMGWIPFHSCPALFPVHGNISS